MQATSNRILKLVAALAAAVAVIGLNSAPAAQAATTKPKPKISAVSATPVTVNLRYDQGLWYGSADGTAKVVTNTAVKSLCVGIWGGEGMRVERAKNVGTNTWTAPFTYFQGPDGEKSGNKLYIYADDDTSNCEQELEYGGKTMGDKIFAKSTKTFKVTKNYLR